MFGGIGRRFASVRVGSTYWYDLPTTGLSWEPIVTYRMVFVGRTLFNCWRRKRSRLRSRDGSDG